MSLSVVFDTNILFSALGWRGTPFVCVELARDGEVESVTCSEILAELEDLLREKRQMTVEEAGRAIEEVLAFSRLVAIPGPFGLSWKRS